MALKNFGFWLGTYTVGVIKADPIAFLYAMLIYGVVNIPADIYMLNKAHEVTLEEAQKIVAEGS